MMETIKQTQPHILVVDDDEIIREAAHESLTEAGFDVSQAENGYLAVQALEKRQPDLILLDVMMPVMDGFKTAGTIRKIKGLESLPILIMTALDDLGSINRAFQVGATDFILKPINWVILIERIRFMVRAANVMKAEQQLRLDLAQAQKMEALGTLAGTVAHDLNNVLAGVVSYPDMLLYNLAKDSPMRKPILTIQNAGKKAAAIVHDLLTLARRGVKVNEVFNINETIAEYLSSPEHANLMTVHPSVSVETHLLDGLSNIAGSPTHLLKTIMNLVSNAAEAQPDGGRIRISTHQRRFDPSQKEFTQPRKGDYVVIEIADKGCGISEEDVDRIFEPFYSKKSMGRSGTGLGMAIVWSTVQDHHGHIDIKSTPNEGTTFLIHLPVTRKQKEKKTGRIPLEAYMGKGQKILIVDDSEEQLEIAVGILDLLNYEPVSVSSGEKALDYLRTHPADLVLLDMIMPEGWDGLETYKRMIAQHPNQKALVVTGFDETDRVKQAIKLGVGACIKKPYTLEAIGLAIKTEIQKPA